VPANAGISKELIAALGPQYPILGVCLGHQAIGEVFGAEVGPAHKLVHGKSSPVFHENQSIFRNVPNPFNAGRYHSLTVTSKELPEDLVPLAQSGDGHLMALRHRHYPIYGVQFHPESILTEFGDSIVQNFLNVTAEN
jgi:anthranilate synthase/aminodeoxychorismate synthase-like glutamine amidotransferase